MVRVKCEALRGFPAGFPFRWCGETHGLVKVVESTLYSRTTSSIRGDDVEVGKEEFKETAKEVISNVIGSIERYVKNPDGSMYVVSHGDKIPVKMDIMPWADSYGEN